MILNIHGFSSNGLSKKSQILKQEFGENIISPSFVNIPTLAFDTAEQIIKICLHEKKTIHLIGSSIGGFMSIYLCEKYGLKGVLINPAIYPYNFHSFIGLVRTSYDGSMFECTKTHLQDLKKYEVRNIKNPQNFLLLLQKGDELLDYKEAEKKFVNSKIIVENGGSHGYDNFESKMKIIREFLCSS